MKLFLTIAAIFFATGFAHAEDSKVKRSLAFGLIYSLADTIEFKGSTSGTAFTGQDSVSKTLGLTAEYNYLEANSIGYSVGLAYELRRMITNGQANGIPYSYSPNVELYSMIYFANLNYSFDSDLYAYVGPNLPSITNKNSTVSYTGKMGYQVGVSYFVSPSFAVGAQYRVLNATGLNSTQTIDSASMNGLVLSGAWHYDF